jgi:hypothetical protein
MLVSLQSTNTRTIVVQTDSINLPLRLWLLHYNKLLENHNYKIVVELVGTQHVHKITDFLVDSILLLNSYFFAIVSLSSGENLSLNISMLQLLRHFFQAILHISWFSLHVLVTATQIISAQSEGVSLNGRGIFVSLLEFSSPSKISTDSFLNLLQLVDISSVKYLT